MTELGSILGDESLFQKGIYVVQLEGFSLVDLKKQGLRIDFYGEFPQEMLIERRSPSVVAVDGDGVLLSKTLVDKNKEIAKIDPSLEVVPPPNAATVLELVQKIHSNYHFNPLEDAATHLGSDSLWRVGYSLHPNPVAFVYKQGG